MSIAGHALSSYLSASTDQRSTDPKRSATKCILGRYFLPYLEDPHQCKTGICLYQSLKGLFDSYTFYLPLAFHSAMLNLTAAFMHTKPHEKNKVHVFSGVSVCHIDESSLFGDSVRSVPMSCCEWVTM